MTAERAAWLARAASHHQSGYCYRADCVREECVFNRTALAAMYGAGVRSPEVVSAHGAMLAAGAPSASPSVHASTVGTVGDAGEGRVGGDDSPSSSPTIGLAVPLATRVPVVMTRHRTVHTVCADIVVAQHAAARIDGTVEFHDYDARRQA
ncbi:hypothetical protein [Cellulomonas uda]|uniref:Uncharacterized protein n=1 Tax=Cellulomonas uda TaxID=1714 RepID=A0A4Y3K7M1_CELUD|nr:hypothetical protein [Cellulomonas uda]NII67791.1 hypothetical protein [Cellulomonas uda]GEA79962.1 hypothetical protein CUD01_04060 [Cellulomonas uda]